MPIDKADYDSRLKLRATSCNNLSADSSSDSSGESTHVIPTSSSSPPNGPVSRGLLGALLGLLEGFGLAFVVDRADRRIRLRAEAEDAFALPVLAEVPQLKKSQKDSEIVAHKAPLSRVAEAYRAVLEPAVHPCGHGRCERVISHRTAT